MKIKLTLVTAVFSIVAANAQNSKVVSTFNYLNNYSKDKAGESEALIKAKTNIDEASLDESTSGKAKTWYYRGNVYLAIGQSTDAKHKDLSQSPYYEAAVSYAKCLAIDPRYEFAKEASQNKNFALAQLINAGVADYSNKKFGEALNLFDQCIKIADEGKYFDTLAVRNAVLASRAGKMNDKAVDYLQKLIDVNAFGSASYYVELFRTYSEMGKAEDGLKKLAEGRAKFKGDANLMIEELNYYLTAGKNVEAEKILKEAIAADPKNPTLYFAAGAVYSNLERLDEAETNLNQAIALKPDFGDALYNLGVVHVKRGNIFIDNYNKFEDQKKRKEADEEMAKATDTFNKAIENIEKARALNPDEVIYISALKDLYGKVENTDKYMEMKKLLDGMKK